MNAVPTTVNRSHSDPTKSPPNTASSLQNSLSETLPRGRQVSNLTSFDSSRKSHVSTLPCNSSHQLLEVTRRSCSSEPLPREATAASLKLGAVGVTISSSVRKMHGKPTQSMSLGQQTLFFLCSNLMDLSLVSSPVDYRFNLLISHFLHCYY